MRVRGRVRVRVRARARARARTRARARARVRVRARAPRRKASVAPLAALTACSRGSSTERAATSSSRFW